MAEWYPYQDGLFLSIKSTSTNVIAIANSRPEYHVIEEASVEMHVDGNTRYILRCSMI